MHLISEYEKIEWDLPEVDHKSYELGKPIEVQVWSDKIEVMSYSGPVPPVDAQQFYETYAQTKFVIPAVTQL